VLIGGIIDDSISHTRPASLLMDIPVIGRAFRSDTTRSTDRAAHHDHAVGDPRKDEARA
jgi:type II secretory pathway component GspD/PulD (secretin)